MKWRDQIRIHPAADMFPLLPRDELLALSKDIVENGLREPPAFWKKYAHERDTEYELMDGRNRFDAIEAAGLEIVFKPRRAETGPPFKIIVKKDGEPVEWGDDVDFKTFFSTEVDPYAYVASANIHRRHLTPEQKRDIIAKVLKAQAHKSNRQIAEQVKVSHHTVQNVRAQMEATGQVAQLARTIGADGKARIVQRHEPREMLQEPEPEPSPPLPQERKPLPPLSDNLDSSWHNAFEVLIHRAAQFEITNDPDDVAGHMFTYPEVLGHRFGIDNVEHLIDHFEALRSLMLKRLASHERFMKLVDDLQKRGTNNHE